MLEQKNWQGLPIHSPYAMRQLSEIGRKLNARGGDADDDMWEKDLQVAGYYLPDGESLETLEQMNEEKETIDDRVERSVEEAYSNRLRISEEVCFYASLLFILIIRPYFLSLLFILAVVVCLPFISTYYCDPLIVIDIWLL